MPKHTKHNSPEPEVHKDPLEHDYSAVRASKQPKEGAHHFIFGFVILVLVVLVISLVAHNHSTNSLTNSSRPPAYVTITSTGFDPATITIKPNQPVVWTNTDTSPHQVASDPYPSDNALAGFKEASPINDGQSYSFVFNKAGSYTYHDELNPSSFKGEVVVR